MSLGASLFLIGVGAILRFAVTADLAGIDIQTVGTILMVIGVARLRDLALALPVGAPARRRHASAALSAAAATAARTVGWKRDRRRPCRRAARARGDFTRAT